MKNIIISILLTGVCLPALANRSERQGKTFLEMSSFKYDYSGFLLDYGISFLLSAADSANSNTKSEREFNQQTVKLGYITSDRYFMGLGYSADRYQATDDASVEQLDENKNFMVGLGYYFQNNFFGHGYFVQQENRQNNRSSSGYRFDLGYKINLLDYFHVSAAISHQRIGPKWLTTPNVSLGLLFF